jgi:hypothetical protein
VRRQKEVNVGRNAHRWNTKTCISFADERGENPT